MKCKLCGAEMSEGNSYCLACGAKMEETPQKTSAPQITNADASPTGSMTYHTIPSYQESVPTNGASAPPPPMSTVAPPSFFEDNLTPVVSVGHWLLALLILFLLPLAVAVICGIVSAYVAEPILIFILGLLPALSALILILVWAFNKRTNPSQRNFFRAYLILLIIGIIIGVAAVVFFANVFVDYLGSMGITELDLQQFMM